MASTTNRRGAGAVRLSFDLLWSAWIGIAASDVVAARIAEHLFQWEQVGAFVDHAAGQPKFTVRTSVQFVTRSQRNTFKQFEKQRQVERAVTPTRQQGTTDLRLIDDDDEIHSAVAVEIVGRKVLGPTCDRIFKSSRRTSRGRCSIGLRPLVPRCPPGRDCHRR